MVKLDSSKLCTPIYNQEENNNKKASLTRFILEVEKHLGSPSKTVTFRFANEYIELLENITNEFYVNCVNVLKAVLQMFDDADNNQKMYIL